MESLESMICSEMYGEKSFNIQVEERKACLEKLFSTGGYEPQPDDESTRNMVKRYEDIAKVFPEKIKGKAPPYFLDWLKQNVVLVEITAYADDNAYTIFESMNDRGLNLTPTDMLKGYIDPCEYFCTSVTARLPGGRPAKTFATLYILSRFTEAKDREKANRFWSRAHLGEQVRGTPG